MTISDDAKPFCDFCPCEQCRTGEDLSHAPCEDGRWICDICFPYTACINAKRAATGSHDGPCENMKCAHRPTLVGPFSRDPRC